MKLVVGLGNRGKKFEGTRHNLGFLVVEEFARKHDFRFHPAKALESDISEDEVFSEKVVLAKPRTFVNLSGRAVAGLLGHFRRDVRDLLVVCDDLDLPLGRLRLRPRGNPGGHKGLQAITETLGSGEFPRLRLGINGARQGEEAAEIFVLRRFEREELPVLQVAVSKAVRTIELWLSEGFARAASFANLTPTSKPANM